MNFICIGPTNDTRIYKFDCCMLTIVCKYGSLGKTTSKARSASQFCARGRSQSQNMCDRVLISLVIPGQLEPWPECPPMFHLRHVTSIYVKLRESMFQYNNYIPQKVPEEMHLMNELPNSIIYTIYSTSTICCTQPQPIRVRGTSRFVEIWILGTCMLHERHLCNVSFGCRTYARALDHWRGSISS